jgi:hypothetical protein
MIKHILIIFSIALTVLPARADEWKAFVGYGGVLDMRQYSNGYQIPISSGSQFELGIRSKNHEWYVAYHQSSSDWQQPSSFGKLTIINDSTDIYERYNNDVKSAAHRILLGYRFHPTRSGNYAPLVGIALNIGRNESARHNYYTKTEEFLGSPRYSNYRYVVLEEKNTVSSESSLLTPSFLVEFGISRHLIYGLDAVALAQLNFLVIINDDYFSDKHHYEADGYLMPSGVLQLRYTFGR